MIDTGSVLTIINKDLYLKISNKYESLISTNNKGICLISASNHKIPIIGENDIIIQIAEKTLHTTVVIAPNIPHDIILGLPTLIQMRLKIDLEESTLTSFSQTCSIISDSEIYKPIPYKNRISLLCFTLNNTKVKIAMTLMILLIVTLISSFFTYYFMAPIIYEDTIKQDPIIFTLSKEYIISNTKLYIHLHAKHNTTRVITVFFKVHKELQKQLGLPQQQVLGYISDESKQIPYTDEKAHAKCLMTINPPLLNDKQ